MKKFLVFALVLLFMLPAAAFALELASNEELAEIRGAGNPALDLFTLSAFGQTGLSQAEAIKLWAAFSEEEKEAARLRLTELLASMTDEEKQALDEQMRAGFESMTPEEHRAMHEEMRAEFDSMTAEEKVAAMELRQEMDEIRIATTGDMGPGPGGFGPPPGRGFGGRGPGFGPPPGLDATE